MTVNSEEWVTGPDPGSKMNYSCWLAEFPGVTLIVFCLVIKGPGPYWQRKDLNSALSSLAKWHCILKKAFGSFCLASLTVSKASDQIQYWEVTVAKTAGLNVLNNFKKLTDVGPEQ